MKKKIVSLFMASLLALSIINVQVTASAPNIVQTFLDVDFDGTVVDSTEKTITVPNKAATPPANLVWTYTGSYSPGFTVFTTDAINTTQNTTSYISCNATKKSVGYNFNMPSPITTASDNVLYLDIRIRRMSLTDDKAGVAFQDSSGNQIFRIIYQMGGTPQLIADATYGTNTNVPANTIVSYPCATGWRYVRAIINFETKTFELYQGESLDTLDNFVQGQNIFPFTVNTATDFNRITNITGVGDDIKGTLGFDDIKVYEVSPQIIPMVNNVSISGNYTSGGTLTGNYDLINADDTNSEYLWETSSDMAFTDPQTVGTDKTYTTKPDDSGKYIRFTVTPVAADGTTTGVAGFKVADYKIDSLEISLSIAGNIKNNTTFDFKDPNNTYRGRVSTVNTKPDSKAMVLMAAWYESGNLVSVKIKEVATTSASSDGAVSETFTTDVVQTIPKGASTTGLTMKVFLFEDLVSAKPVVKSVYAGVNF